MGRISAAVEAEGLGAGESAGAAEADGDVDGTRAVDGASEGARVGGAGRLRHPAKSSAMSPSDVTAMAAGGRVDRPGICRASIPRQSGAYDVAAEAHRWLTTTTTSITITTIDP
jgi:hypothetical protein